MVSIGSRYHSVLIYWHMVKIVKPNNDMMIEKAKKELKALQCKRFNDDVSTMLIQFELKLDEITVTLGGSMTEEEKVTTMWDAVLTCRDQEFCRRINDMRRAYRRTPKNQRESLSTLIQEIKDEQVNMAADGIFNQPDKSCDHTLALTSVVEQLVKTVNSTGGGNSNYEKREDKPKRDIPAWKYKREGDETQKVVDGRTYHWCSLHKGPNGKKNHGMWCLHTEEEHGKKQASSESRGSGDSKKKGSFNNHKKDSDKTKSNTENSDNGPKISVDRKLFSAIRKNSNVQSFLSKMKDDTSSVKGKA